MSVCHIDNMSFSGKYKDSDYFLICYISTIFKLKLLNYFFKLFFENGDTFIS